MRLFVSVLTLFFSLSVIAAPVDTFRLMVFGDSLASGHRLPKKDAFYSQLEQALQKKGYDITVIHASKSGETTAGGLKRQAAALKQKPDAVLLELGVNDAIRGYPIADIRSNLETLIETFQSHQVPVLLIGMQAPPTRPITYQQQFANIYTDLSQQYDVPLYPFFMDGIFTRVPGLPLPVSDKVLNDNVHPNAEGVALMVDRILPTVQDFLDTQEVIIQR